MAAAASASSPYRRLYWISKRREKKKTVQARL